MEYPLTDPRNTLYADVDFSHLMYKRVNKVLLLCSKYDAFILEEDGRIDEQIFKEYVRLNLRYPPHFIHVTTEVEALRILEDQPIDLVINMLSMSSMDPFEFSKKVKTDYPELPVVLLTTMSRENTLKIASDDLSSVDYVFSWLGHADLLLAIVKLIEDKINADYDVNQVGVQAILLVEDSITFYSSYLPNIYNIIITQSKTFTHEGLNEYQKTVRLRGRPKILFAKNYEEAWELFKKYQHNILGIISDISYPREGRKDEFAGLVLCKMVREEDKTIPFLLQSTNMKNQRFAEEMRAGFIHKNSKTLLQELRSYLMDHLAFGDFLFVSPS
ncbi:MAG: phosphoenolpyruvate synthase, partial [Bacteroidales bacterium]|nr:phosphoenolpyruvate synthase [Bacteroidales bacterium]